MYIAHHATYLVLSADNAPHSRKTLIYLILTLNHIYPDYDFSLLRANHFLKEDGLAKAEENIDSYLLEVSKVGETMHLQCCVPTNLCLA